MLPEHRSSDAAWQGRDYRSAASAKQIRFSLRRSKVRGQSKGVQKRENASLKQQTLTQMDFISSFGEEVALTDDDVSDETTDEQNKFAIPRRNSEAQIAKKPQESTRENTPVIQDSFGSTDCSFHDDMLAKASPPRFQPRQVREAAVAPRSMGIREPLDAVRASPRRRAHLSRDLDGSKRLKQCARADDISLLAHVHSPAEEADDREIPDSDEDNEDLQLQLQDYRLIILQDTFVMGQETQRALEEFSSLENPGVDHKDMLTNKLLIPTPHSSTLISFKGAANIEVVLQPTTFQSLSSSSSSSSSSVQTKLGSDGQTGLSRGHKRHDPATIKLPCQSQVFESQRVPLHILQSFAPASARTDILLPISSKLLSSIVDGSETSLHLTYRVPEQVGRFWLFDHNILRYMACVQPGKAHNLGWDYRIDQVYELNNPVEEHDMQEEGWVNGQVRRYIYLPPAIVGQLLWNLRCATFGGGGFQREDGHGETSNNMGELDCRSSNYNSTRSPVISPQSVAQAENYIRDHDTGQPSSLLFQDHGSSLATLPTNVAFDSSPLLTKSQMLSDSLVNEDLL
ncbi:hypothetical protein V8C37DRAFT_397310 [Trichoderma ceciliae]